jgi:hypothetical protein
MKRSTCIHRSILMLVASLACLILPAKTRAQDLTGLYLTWSHDPATTMTINWVDLYPKGTLQVFYRQLGSEGDWREVIASQKTLAPSAMERRFIELTGLLPDTTYEFGIGKRPEKPNEGWRFRTMPADLSKRPVRFVAGGDMMHTRELVDAMNKIAGALEPDFALLGGDLAYEDGVRATRIAEWLESWMRFSVGADRRLIPMVVAIGNHEVRGGYGGKIPDDAMYFYGLFTLPDDRSYYALDFGQYLSLIVLDSGHTQPFDGPQAQWLGTALAARPQQQYVFPVYHYPAYGTTKAPENGTPLDAPRAIAIRQHWVPHFETFGVTGVFENDHHNYKRTVPIRKHKRNDANGIIYFGDGAWGVRTRDVPAPGTAWWLERAEERNHLWCVDLTAEGKATLRAIDAKGEVFDEITLDQARTPPESFSP